MTRLQCALVSGAITLGLIVVGSLCPTMLGGGVECARSTSRSDFQTSVFWCFALIGIVARRVFWLALVFAGVLIFSSHDLVAFANAKTGALLSSP